MTWWLIDFHNISVHYSAWIYVLSESFNLVTYTSQESVIIQKARCIYLGTVLNLEGTYKIIAYNTS